MSKTIQIGSESFQLPTQGDSPEDKGTKRSWGENLSDIIEAIVDRVNTLSGPDDIPESAEVILNTAGDKQLVSFHFNSSTVRSFESSYNVSRTITKEILSYSGDGSTVTVTLSYNHDLRNGAQITISGAVDAAVNGTKTITKISDTSFSFSEAFNGSGASGTFEIELIENGVLIGNYSLNGWSLAQTKIGNAKLSFDLDNTGTITYSPEVISGATGSYEGLIKFIAKSLINA